VNENTKRRATIERVAELAMALSRPHMADYGASRSRHDFTQRQLMSCLVLRAYLKTTYRGVLDVLLASASLRECLGLREKLPHYAPVQPAATTPCNPAPLCAESLFETNHIYELASP
jgi:hypothetical protein